MFVYKLNKETNKFEVDTRDFKAIKSQLLFQMTNFGQPIIKIENANFENRGELLIQHVHEGLDLQPNYMDATMQNLFKIWKRPVNLITIMDNEPQLFRFDGKEYTKHALQENKKSESGAQPDIPKT
jgi:stage V sporulation protein R